MSLRSRILSLVIGLNLLLTTVFTWWGYRTQLQLTREDVDEDLLFGSLVLRQYLSDNNLNGEFHDRVFDGLTMSDAEFFETMHLLYDVVRKSRLAYFYTVIEKDGALRFVVDSPSPEEIKTGAVHNSFLHPYEKPPLSLRKTLETGETTLGNYIDEWGEYRSIFVRFKTPKGRHYAIGVDIGITELKARLRRSLLAPLAVGMGVLFLSLTIALLTIRRVVFPLRSLARSTALIAEGNLDEPIQQSPSRDEIGALSQSFEYMRRSLKEYIENLAVTTAAKERIENELRIARTIQKSMLPRPLPAELQRPEFALEGYLEPAKEVGGDLYDYFFIDDNHLFLTVGDVSDKGVPAALFMAVAKTLIKSAASCDISPSEVLTRVNLELCKENSELMFVTVFCGILDIRTGELRYSNGGHNPPLLIRANGSTDWLIVPEGLVLGIDSDAIFETRESRLDTGETLLIYSDGVTEAMNPERKLYSETRLKKVGETCLGMEPEATVEIVMHSVNDFVSGATPSDDITILAVCYKGKGNKTGRKDQ